jgi:mannose-6-phosphate isomerase-like protein (cupin superfamily)
MKKPYVGNIEKETLTNKAYRKVIFTGKHTQLVEMVIQPGDEIGSEVHPGTDQFFRIEKGKALFVLDGTGHTVEDGGGVLVPAGTRHNVINISDVRLLQLYTLYSPPEHRDGLIQQTNPNNKKK